MNPRNLIRKFKQLIKKANLPVILFHNLRHTHATILMRMGENPNIVSERLGHSRVETTLGIYSHSNEEMQKNTADRFEEKFGSDYVLVKFMCSLCAINNNHYKKWKYLKTKKKPKPLIFLGLSLLIRMIPTGLEPATPTLSR